jgi:excisionase family DNA binding protein
MPQNLADQLAFTAAEAAVAGRVRKFNIDTAVRDGSLPTHRVGLRSLILRRDLEAWIESHPPRRQRNQHSTEE